MTLLINLNDHVKVKLTDFGRGVLKDLYVTKLGIVDYEIKEDEEGYYHTQVHLLMNIFGEHLHQGGKLPFEMNICVY